MRVIVIIVGLVAGLAFSVVNADVWEFRGDGSTVFHQALDYTQRNRLNSDWKAPTPFVLRARRANYDPMVREIAVGQGVDPHLVHALIEVESAYDRFAVSKAGAIGIMQLMPKTAARFGVADSRDAKANIRGGVKYLAFLGELFPGQPEFVIAAYHAGENRVAPCLEKPANSDLADCERREPRMPNIPETQKHVELVMQALGRRLEAAEMANSDRVANVTHSTGGDD